MRRTVTLFTDTENVGGYEITLSKGAEVKNVILIPNWWPSSSIITKIVDTCVVNELTWRGVNTHDIITFTQQWERCHPEDNLMFLDVWVSVKELTDGK